MQDAAVVVEQPFRFGIIEVVVRSDLSCRGQSGNEAGLLAVDQRVGAAVPGSPLALDKTGKS